MADKKQLLPKGKTKMTEPEMEDSEMTALTHQLSASLKTLDAVTKFFDGLTKEEQKYLNEETPYLLSNKTLAAALRMQALTDDTVGCSSHGAVLRAAADRLEAIEGASI